MTGISKNLGPVSALFIGESAPTNTSLVWYDNTPSVKKHKVYDFNLGSWVVLNPNSFTSISYATLRSLAIGTGLTQLSWYKITDKGNCLALAITQTKVQYVDSNNNFIIDDLAASAIYVVNSGNLYVDDKVGVWDGTTNRLKFEFTAVDVQTSTSGEDYLWGKRTSGGIGTFVKHKIKSLISAVTGNSISWNKGFYFNFLESLRSVYDTDGGVASKGYVDTQLGLIDASIGDLGEAITQTYANALTAINNAVTATNIYGKRLPSAPTVGVPVDISVNDTLLLIVNKIQRWINNFKYANGIKVTDDFSQYGSNVVISPGDSVDVALRKLQKWSDSLNRQLNERDGIVDLISAIQTKLDDNLFPGGLVDVKLNIVSGDNFQFPFCFGLCINSGNYIIAAENSGNNYEIDLGDGSRTDILAFQSPIAMFKEDYVAGAHSGMQYDVYAALRHKSGITTIQFLLQIPTFDSEGSQIVERYLSYQVIGNVFGHNLADILMDQGDSGQIALSSKMIIQMKVNIPEDAIYAENYYMTFSIDAHLS